MVTVIFDALLNVFMRVECPFYSNLFSFVLMRNIEDEQFNHSRWAEISEMQWEKAIPKDQSQNHFKKRFAARQKSSASASGGS